MSGSGGIDDPFGWSNERLVQELCTPQRSWPAPLPKKWPDPKVLAEKLQEHDLDGSDLLCYEDLMGQGGFESLCSDLGIVKIPHKASLRVAISLFQKRSPEYRAWKKSQTASDSQGDSQGQARNEDEHDSPSRQQQAEASDAISSSAPTVHGNGYADNAAPQPASDGVSDALKGNGDKTGSNKNGATNGYTNGNPLPEAMDIDTPASTPSIPVDQSRKRKRLVPTNISSTPMPRARPVGVFGVPLAGNPEQLWQNSASGAYLGDWALTKYALLQGTDPLGPNNSNDEPTDNFGWSRPLPIPAGRRLQVDHVVRRYLQPTRPSTAGLGRTPRARTNDALAAVAQIEDEDEVLPALGESDDEGYDTETWEAMEQEAKEKAEQKKRKNGPLSLETFDAVIADAIRDIETKWSNKKLQKLRRREHRLWTSARRAGSRKILLNKALTEVDRYEQRITKLVQEMRLVEWKNEKEIRLQANLLDANIEDRQYALWEARLYSSPSVPPKPVEGEKRRRPSAPRVPHPKLVHEHEEILTSSSSDDDSDRGLQNFVVNDEDDGDDQAMLSDGLMGMLDDSIDLSPVGKPMDAVVNGIDKPQPKRTSVGPQATQAFKASASTLAADFPLEDLAAIAKKGVSFWEAAGDITRLLCTIFSTADGEQLARLFHVLSLNVDDFWQKFCVPVIEGNDISRVMFGPEDDATAFTRYFYIFLTLRDVAPKDFNSKEDKIRQKIVEGRSSLGSFCVKMRTISPYFGHLLTFSRQPSRQPSQRTKSVTPDPENKSRAGTEVVNIDSDDENDDDLYVMEVRTVTPQESDDGDDDGDDDDKDVRISPSFRRRGRLISRDQGAQNLRDRDKARQVEQENRRKVLYENLAQTGQLSHDQARLIINEAKDKHHGFVYVNSWIGRSIRNHQVEGVRFMWNTLIAPPDSRQGCLLAHTMGLGKTMQVITLLVAIAESAKSSDETISSQIPEDLRESKTLILCPPGLVDNWRDELLTWARPETLGENFQVASGMNMAERIDEVRQWAKQGGTMVIGYNMFGVLVKDFGSKIVSLLEKTPNIVVADEAHMLKNPQSQIHQLTKNFRTSARIAMTGSPLANSVSEYHAMINWVAPNYLAARDEFNALYANPIKEGFYRDSTAAQKRHAYKMLKVLKDTVAPKIHRVTISSLENVLPDKREFILYLPLTPLQMQVYSTFIKLIKQPTMMSDINTTVQMWNLLINLTLLLAHPKIFKERLIEMKTNNNEPGSASKRTGTLPPNMIDDLLAAVNTRNIENVDYSSKIVVLTGILDEAKRVGEKVLVFSQSKLVLDHLETVFQRQKRLVQRLDGDTAVGKRQAMVKRFNVSDDEVYLISTTAGGVGLNIQGANRVVIFDFKWNPMHEQQAIGRAYRIGQTRKVFVYWLIVGETFETVLHDQAVFKTQLASRVVDKKNPSAWADQIKNYTKEPSVMARDPSLSQRFKSHDPVLDALLADGSTTSQRICTIVSTDTFEQEEPEAKLSAEELTEAHNMVHMNKMRFQIVKDGVGNDMTGPRRIPFVAGGPSIERMQVDNADFAPAMVAPFRSRPTATPIPVPPSLVLSSQTSQPVQATVTTTANAVPPTIPSQALPASAVPSNAPSQALPAPMQIATSNLPPPPPMQIRTQNSVDSGVNFVQGSYVGDDPLFLDPVPEPPVQEPTDPPMDLSSSSSLASNPEELIGVLKTALLSGNIVRQRQLNMRDADMMARKAVFDIERTFQLAGLPARAQWGRLKALVSREPGLVEIVVYGAVEPSKLASMSASEETKFVTLAAKALGEMRTHLLDGIYNEYSTPNTCALLGTQETLERVLERKLFEGATSYPRATGSPIAGTVARDVCKEIVAATPDDRKVYVFTRYALRIFRDPIFADAVVGRNIDFQKWARSDPGAHNEVVRRLHEKHALENRRNHGPGEKSSPSTANYSRPAKAESMDDAASRREFNNIPSRPNSTPTGRPGGNDSRPSAPNRTKDPDHVKHHLNRSQNRRPSAQDTVNTGPSAATADEAPRQASGPRTSSADILAMREVMERRERKSIVPSLTTPPALPPPMSIPQSQPHGVSPGYMPRASNPHHVPSSQPYHPLPPRPLMTAPETPQPTRITGPQRSPIPPHLLRAELERSLLEADRLQQSAKKERANLGTKGKGLPPKPPNQFQASSSQPPKAGDNARNPFVLDD
ncbi:hypothetical protein SEUCBS140593_005242 [Sporothrix eucalyptigena]|uniref:Snf2 family helicase n=1 Tax=Sporothrix eucalyptigena TaxID=1812306 RepID=A0ABP0BVK9_9PEZI